MNTGGFTFDPSLDFFGQEQRTSPINEKQTWPFSWTPVDLSSSSYEYDTPSSSSVSTFLTPSKPIDIPVPMTSKQRGEETTPRWFFSRPYTPYFSAAKRLFAARNSFGLLSPRLPPGLKRSRRTTWPKWSRTGIQAVFRRPGRVVEGLVAA